MHRKNSNVSRVSFAPGFMALFAVLLAMGLDLMASPAAAALFASPAAAALFAYVTNGGHPWHCLGDRHGHQHGGGHGPGGDFPRWGRRHPGRDTRLCHE